MPTWTVKADRRRADVERLADRLQSLEDSIRGLSVAMVDDESFQSSPDAGNLRDFAPVARLTHEEIRGLEIVAERLLDEFGWVVDLARDEP